MSYLVCDRRHNILANVPMKWAAEDIAKCLSNTNFLVYTNNPDDDFISLYWKDNFIGTLNKRGDKND